MLVDTSVWVDHLARGNARLAVLLEQDEVQVHPFVIGELALGRLRCREEILAHLAALPSVPAAEHHEVLGLVSDHDLAGSGVGWVDAHLLASALIGGTTVWTLDRPLATAAERLGVNGT
jgi:hypothetical protein